MKNDRRIERRRAPLVLRAFNAAGRALEGLGLFRMCLDEQVLCAAARRKTGLSDFGDERFRPLLRQQISDLQDLFGRFQFVGRLMARVWLRKGLCNRLLIEQQIKEHPEVLRVTVPRPLIVAGLPRTGTTLLANLLNQDPGSRALVLGEGLSPAGSGGTAGRGGDPRLRRAARLVKLGRWVAPQLHAVYIVEANAPVECGMLFRNTFLPRYVTAKDLSHWRAAFSPDTWEWAYREYYRQLQLLEWQHPAPDHWVLKWPEHLWALDIVLKTMPEATIVQTHRAPEQVVPALCQAAARFGYLLSDERWESFPEYMLSGVVEGLRRSMEMRQRIPSSRVCDVSYTRLIADPIGALREIYDHLGYRYSDEFERRARAWLRDHPAPRRGERYYDLEQLGLDPAAVKTAVAFYAQQSATMGGMGGAPGRAAGGVPDGA
jgi:sulfotransferase family protein